MKGKSKCHWTKSLSRGFLLCLSLLCCSLSFTLSFGSSRASAFDITGISGNYWQHYDCYNPWFSLSSGTFVQGFTPIANDGIIGNVKTCANNYWNVQVNDIYVVDIMLVNSLLEGFVYSNNQTMHLLQSEQISQAGDRTQYRLYYLATNTNSAASINPGFKVRNQGYAWVMTVLGYRVSPGSGTSTTDQILSDIRNMTNDTNLRLDSTNSKLDQIISKLDGDKTEQQLNQINNELKTQTEEQKKQTEAINNQTEQEKNQYEQDKQEEADREQQGNADSETAQGIFNFNILNPFAPLFEMFNPGGCVSIPTLSSWLHTEDTQVCPWFPASVRSVLTPVLSITSMMLLFGFVVGWLNGNDANGIIRVTK